MTLLALQLLTAYLGVTLLARPRRASWPAGAARHLLAMLVAVNVGLTPESLPALGALAAIHATLHHVSTRRPAAGWGGRSGAQAAHLAAILGCIAVLQRPATAEIAAALRTAAVSPHLYFYATAYLAVVFGGGVAVQNVTQFFMGRVASDLAMLKPGLPHAGQYIGWLERAVILTLLLWGPAEAVGFVLAAKTLARYPEIKEDAKGHFAEYFLIGTLTSVGLALLAGLLCTKVRALL